ncbi:hypothetical protein GCM10019017_55640 [Streptomyces showdoensis]
MPEPPSIRPAVRSADLPAADAETLVDMGELPEQPTPEHQGLFVEPDWPQEE